MEPRIHQANNPRRKGGAVTLHGDGYYSFTLVLEGPRSNDKDGRTYWITVQGVDRAGNPGSRSVPVIVPRR